VRPHLELNIQFSPGVGNLQSYGVHRVVVHLFFQPVFWGRGLPAVSQVTLPVHSCPVPCQMGGLSGNWSSVWLLFPGGFPLLFRGSEQKWPQPNLWPRAEKSQSALFNRPSRTQSPLLHVPLKTAASHGARSQLLSQKCFQGPRRASALCASKTVSG